MQRWRTKCTGNTEYTSLSPRGVAPLATGGSLLPPHPPPFLHFFLFSAFSTPFGTQLRQLLSEAAAPLTGRVAVCLHLLVFLFSPPLSLSP